MNQFIWVFPKFQLISKIWHIRLIFLPIIAKLKKDKMYGSYMVTHPDIFQAQSCLTSVIWLFTLPALIVVSWILLYKLQYILQASSNTLDGIFDRSLDIYLKLFKSLWYDLLWFDTLWSNLSWHCMVPHFVQGWFWITNNVLAGPVRGCCNGQTVSLSSGMIENSPRGN